jgi:arylsulfatase A-like enzyme
LLVRAPGLAPAVVTELVGTVDIFPTLMELLGVEGVEPRAGRSLLSPRADRTLVAESRYQYESLWTLSARRDRWLLHCNDGGGPCELFDTATDPRCERDVAREHPDLRSALRRELGRQLDPFRSEPRMRARRAAFEARWR